jgi:hypothetical protein
MVTCQICGKQMKWIQNTHLKHHDITLEEYRAKYPGSPTKTQEMHDELVRTRKRVQRKPIIICAREGCNDVVKHRKHRYCSTSCRSKDNYRDNLGMFATTEGNPGYVNGEYAHGKSQKQKAYERDNGKCQRCGCDVGKDKKYGIHHLVPRRLFIDKTLADSLSNLVTLCSKDHRDVEAEFVEHLFELYSNKIYMEPQHLMVFLRDKIRND